MILLIVLVYVLIKKYSFGRTLYRSFNEGDYIGNIKYKRIDPIGDIKRSISSQKSQ